MKLVRKQYNDNGDLISLIEEECGKVLIGKHTIDIDGHASLTYRLKTDKWVGYLNGKTVEWDEIEIS